MGKKGTSRREKTWGKNGLVHLHLFRISIFCFFDLFFAFILHVVCFFPGKKQNKCKIKATKNNRENKINAKQMQMDKSIFPCFFPFCFFPLFQFLFCFCFFLILLICFLVFPLFLHLSRFFFQFFDA